jgi:tetratricopeptide (TPR) repeat protein
MRPFLILLALVLLFMVWAEVRTAKPVFDAEAAYTRYLLNGDLVAVEELCQHGQRGQLDALGWQRLGLICLSLEQPNQAVQALSRSIDLDPKLSRSWFALADSCSLLDEGDLRRSALDEAHRLDDRDVVEAVQRLLEQGDSRRALERGREYLRVCAGSMSEVAMEFFCWQAMAATGNADHISEFARRTLADSRISGGLRPALYRDTMQKMEDAAHRYLSAQIPGLDSPFSAAGLQQLKSVVHEQHGR